MSCINAYVWNLEKWYSDLFQGKNRDTDVRNNVWTSVCEVVGKGGWEELEDWD